MPASAHSAQTLLVNTPSLAELDLPAAASAIWGRSHDELLDIEKIAIGILR